MEMFRTIGLALGVAAASVSLAEQSGRPDDLTLTNFLSGPNNRWAFSHVRELIPTVNIPHDPGRLMRLDKSTTVSRDLLLEWRGEKLSLDEIASQQYIDGILVLKDGNVVLENYYGQLKPNRPHVMMLVTKSVVGILAGILADKGVIDLSKSVADYVPALTSSGWGPDSLRTLLDMRDGADFSEDGSLLLQDCAVGWSDADACPANGPRGGYEFLMTVDRNEDNLGHFVYKSGSTDVIGWVLEEVTGEPLAQLISKYI
ncbi:MAG: serine hydrolase [Haliea sp.]|uniref:serine hydrolase domain-containing protein n=1 Tax=Haliea sp. TaxID=1932666 RepID=UPI0032EC0654